MGNPYEKKREIDKRRRQLMEDLVRLSNEYITYELPDVPSRYAKPKPAMRPAARRAEVRKIMANIVEELDQDVRNMSLAELSLFAAQVSTIAMDRTIKQSNLKKFFTKSAEIALQWKRERLTNLDAFFVVDSKAKGKPISTVPTMEAVIEHMTRISGGKVELMRDLQFNRYMVIAGKRVSIHHEVRDVDLEITLNI